VSAHLFDDAESGDFKNGRLCSGAKINDGLTKPRYEPLGQRQRTLSERLHHLSARELEENIAGLRGEQRDDLYQLILRCSRAPHLSSASAAQTKKHRSV